jgi:hypothetical protein
MTINRYTTAFIRSLQEAPTEFILLSNEISDWASIINQIDEAQKRSNAQQINPSDSARISVLQNLTVVTTSPASLLIVGVERFFKSLKKTSALDGRIEVNRLNWARKRKTALHFQQKLATIKPGIQLQLASNTA